MKKHWILTLCLSWMLSFALGNDLLAQDKKELTQPKVPLEQLLNPDGTLDFNKGFQGSLDPAGWQMMTGPNGEPRFVPADAEQQTEGSAQLMAVPGDENWDDRFATPGPNHYVFAIAVSGGEVYAAGIFTTVGGVVAHNIAKWNGTSWSALGSGVNYVRAIAVSGSEVYAGGYFMTAGGVAANHIAKWDGTNWSALGSGVNGTVHAIAVSGSDVYAAGDFTTAGGVAANKIAKWDGTNWSTLGSELTIGWVTAIAASGNDLYAGGYFTPTGGVAAYYVAKWNGTSWSVLGSGMNFDNVSAIAVSGNDLYAAGYFTPVGGVAAYYIAKWDGTSWSALGGGLNNDARVIVVNNSEVYAGGAFTIAGGVATNYIAKWDGTSWSALGSGMNDYNGVYAIAVSGNEVYAGGEFTTAGGVGVNYIAKWDGNNWSGLHNSNQNGVNSLVYAIAVSGSDMYVGGIFVTAGEVVANYIAKWNGTAWSALEGGMNGPVYAIAVSGSDVYAGGYFTTAGGEPANRIAKWDGTRWWALEGGMHNSFGDSYCWVRAIAVRDQEVYAGGWFSSAGGVAANNIAKWDGTNWSPLGSGMNSIVWAIEASTTELYAGGQFTTAGGVPANRIAQWDGTSWSALGSGMNEGVVAIAVSGSDVYAGGWFTTVGEVATKYIAKWNGANWSALGGGMSYDAAWRPGKVSEITVSGSEVYVGGVFTTAGGVPANNIAKWDGTNWSALGSGVSYGGYIDDEDPCFVSAIAITSSEVYAGGRFTFAGDKPSSNFARYTLNNQPKVIAGGPYSVNEGASVTVTASGNDPENSPLTYAWDLDNNGSFEAAGQSATFSAAEIDGPASRTIQVQVTDDGGLTATDQATVNVVNVAPTATFTSTPDTVIVGQSTILAFSDQSDPSAADVTAGFTYSYDGTNDGTFEISDVAATSYTCPYPVCGTFTAKGRIKDKDGGFTDYAVQIVVQTPKEATGSLIDQIQNLIDAEVLNEGQGNSLISKLEAIIKQLDKGNTTAAINQLQAFINEVNAFIESGTLTPEEGQPLIDAATAIIAALNNPQLPEAGFQADASEGLTAVVQNNGSLPNGFQLEQNAPNPFNPVTTICYHVPMTMHVNLKVYNVFGQEVASIVDETKFAGSHKVEWNAAGVTSGIYFCRIQAADFVAMKKLMLLR